MKLNIGTTAAGKPFRLPLDFVTKTTAILAQRRKGKTYTASVIAEELVEAKQPFVALDPTGAWWGLLASENGRDAGLPVVVLGGQHGHVPLERTGGALVADLVVESPGFYVIDFSLFESANAERQFATDFAERLYRRKAQANSDFPLHLFVDEADRFVPQRSPSGDQRMLGAFEAIVRRGGLRGLGTTLISQRSAVVNKNVLEQIDCLITLRTVGPNDQAAIDDYIKAHGSEHERKTMMASLASLELGEAWVWEPGAEPALFERVQIRKRTTFNSSATPKPGEKRVEPRKLAEVDIAAVRERMAATIEKAKTDDPVELKRTISDLRRQLASRPVEKQEVKAERVEVPVLTKQETALVERYIKTAEGIANKLGGPAAALVDGARNLATALQRAQRVPAAAITRTRPNVEPPDAADVTTAVLHRVPLREVVAARVANGLTGPEQRILDALAWMESIGVLDPEQTAAAFLAGYTIGGGAWNNPRGALKTKGLIEYRGDRLALTDEGRLLAREPDRALTTEELHRKVMERLPGPEQKLLHVLLEQHPAAIENDALARAANYEPGGGAFNNPRGRLRTLGLIERTSAGLFRARDILFPEIR